MMMPSVLSSMEPLLPRSVTRGNSVGFRTACQIWYKGAAAPVPRQRREAPMKLCIALTVVSCLVCAAAAAVAAPGDVLGAFPLDIKTPSGLAWDGSHFWVSD